LRQVSIADFGSYLPGEPVGIDFFQVEGAEIDPLADSPLLRAPKNRHHVAPDERAAEMIEKAARPMFDRLGLDPSGNIDLLITNVLLPDHLFTGCGAETAERLGCVPGTIIDLQNGGCASFPFMLQLAQTIISSGLASTALLANVQNSGGHLFAQPQVRKRTHAAVPGDGCGVAYVTATGDSPVLGVRTRNTPNTAMDLALLSPDGRKYWKPGTGEIDIVFDTAKTKETLALGNRLVPEVVEDLCKHLDITPAEIDLLVTNQPNRIFLANWRKALGVPAERHLDTFDRFGNLYGAGVPVTLDHALRAGRIRKGDFVVMAGFAHAGDFASAAAMRWLA
jgi:3-oxoacyl-[acyl-carrier-protein] synthase-3